MKYQIVINRLFHDDEITFSNRVFVGADNPHEKTPDGVIRRATQKLFAPIAALRKMPPQCGGNVA